MISDRGSRTMRVTRAWLALACASCALAAWALGTGCMLAAAAEARGTPVVPGDGFAPGWLRSG
ncbi:MAG: hypothetical protein JW952_01805, partial [Candidatus Eisenbacteria bacterium]|nr:hypothetical protein [Candidatus Eisenbacteria bacterium]